MSQYFDPPPDTGPVVAPRSAEEARREYASALAECGWLRATLSGCDWCCGGGSESFAAWASRADQAKAWLDARGEPCPEPKETCGWCGYADAAPGSDECAKCASCWSEADERAALNDVVYG